MKFSANLQGLWSHLDLPEAIEAAYTAGFDAVECLWPYVHYPIELILPLVKSDLSMVVISTAAGNLPRGDNGLSATQYVGEAQGAIDKAVAYAADISCPNIKLLAGNAEGKQAQEYFISNLLYASKMAAEYEISVLIEPLSVKENRGYFLTSLEHAAECIDEVSQQNVGILFSYYDVCSMGLDPFVAVSSFFEYVKHISIASYPGGREPVGDKDRCMDFLSELKEFQYSGYVAADYTPSVQMGESVRWLRNFKNRLI